MTEEKKKLAYLSDVLYVPSEHVRREHLEAYTYRFERAVYERPEDVVKKCANCKFWKKPWTDHNGVEVLCHQRGYTENDYCKKFDAKQVKRIEYHELVTYGQPSSEFYTFGRGDLGKVERVFQGFEFVDQRSAPPLGIPLKLKENRVLRPDQVQIVSDWLKAGYGILKAPTGAGKTVMWCYLVQHIGLKTLLLAQEVRHLQVGFEGLYEHTNIAELEEELGQPLCGRLGHDHYFLPDGTAKFKKSKDPGKTYPITFSTFQALNSKTGKELMAGGLKDAFGLVWLEECLVGSTLIPTSKGLVRLDRLVEDPSNYKQNVELEVGSRFGMAKTERWFCNGKQPTLKVTTKSGYSYTGTYNHKMLVISKEGDQKWIETVKLSPGDTLCLSRSKTVRKEKLLLEDLRLKEMTPLLAWFLGRMLCASDGDDTFDLVGKFLYFSKISVSDLDWERLGFFDEGLPWSILQADEESQLAFIASLFEKLGQVSYDGLANLNLMSIGSLQAKHIQILLQSLGYFSVRTTRELWLENAEDSYNLLISISKYFSNDEYLDKFWSPSYTAKSPSKKEEEGYRLEKIVSIEEAGEQLVYDLVMKDKENRSFIANGLISSNCHHESAETFHHVTKSFNSYYKGGQSATPTRKDETHFATYDTVGPITAIGTKEQMVCQYTFINTGVMAPDRLFYGQYPLPKLFTFMSMDPGIQECVLQWMLYDIQSGRKPLYITERKADAFSLKDKIHLSGYNVELIMGGTEAKKQSDYSDRLLSGKLHAIIGTKVIRENYNIPPLDTLHLLYPNFGVETEEQMTGRIRRFVLDADGNPIFKNQPLIRVYTVKANNSIPKKAMEFRKAFYRKMGFEELQLTSENSTTVESVNSNKLKDI